MSTEYTVSVENKLRLDVFAQDLLPSLSRSAIQRLINEGKITANNKAVKSGYMLHAGDTVVVAFDPQESQIADIDIPILYEDEDCIVLDKPVGTLTHSKGAFNPEATVASFIAPKLRDLSGERAGIVHRLDRATSGVIICAKNQAAQTWLQKQFAQRKTKKTYRAVIQGVLSPDKAVIDMPVERDPHHPKQFRVGSTGRSAQTAYETLKQNRAYSLLDLKPVTGRTHQLRVHLKQLGHPIVGDTLYGGKQYDRLMLHAYSLELTLPNRERKTFTSELPNEFNDIMR